MDGVRVVEIRGSVAGGYCAKLLADQGASVATIGDVRFVDGVEAYLGRGEAHIDLEAADVVIQSSAPEPLVPVRVAPSAIGVEISPFGSSGPYADYRSTELTDQALSGHLYLTGDPEREPLRGPPHQVAYAAGAHAAIGTVAGLLWRAHTGRGERVEVSHHEVMVALHQFTLLRYTHNGDVLARMGNRYAGPGRAIGAYHCQDGMISLVVPRDDQLERLLAVAGLDHLRDEPDIASTYDLMHHPTLLDEHLVPWFAARRCDETVALLQDLRVPAGPVSSMADLLEDEHLAAREFWCGSDVRLPRSPIRMARSGPRSAPKPLAEVRVLDLTRVWAGPLATRILGDLGADVIMIEAPWARGPREIDISSVMATRYYPDNDPGPRHWNRIGFNNKYSINKRGVAMDLTEPGALAAFEGLVADADVVIENFSPRVMPQLGLSEERLHELNPDLIYVTMPGFGRSGPATDRVAYGPMIDSHAGMSALQGYPDEPAWQSGIVWPDPVAGLHAAFGTLVALFDGDVATVEVAQLEATVAMVGHALASFQLTGREPDRPSNRVYRCKGQDRWIAIDEAHGRDFARWASTREQYQAMEELQAQGIPAAVVTDAAQVMEDPHLAARGFFVDVAHTEAGTHRWPRLAIRFSGADATTYRPAPLLNQHAEEILGAELAARITIDTPPQ